MYAVIAMAEFQINQHESPKLLQITLGARSNQGLICIWGLNGTHVGVVPVSAKTMENYRKKSKDVHTKEVITESAESSFKKQSGLKS